MALIDAVIVLSIFGALGFVIYAKMAKNNPVLAEKTKALFSGGLYKKPEGIDLMSRDKIEQVYEEKRSMM